MPSPSHARSQPPPKPPARKLRMAIAIAIPLALILGCLWLFGEFRLVNKELLGYYKIKLNDDRDEVTYRLGHAPMVIGAAAGDGVSRFQPVYFTDPATDPKNALPSGKSVNDFTDWEYPVDPDTPKGPFVVVHFGPDQRVATVVCTDVTPLALVTCRAVGGVNIGDSEEDMIAKLGVPSRTTISGVTKTAEYFDLGLSLYLTRGKVYSLALSRTGYSSIDLFLNYMSRVYLTRLTRL
jgi:hypothetical protein